MRTCPKHPRSRSMPRRSRHTIIDGTLRIVTRRHSSELRLYEQGGQRHISYSQDANEQGANLHFRLYDEDDEITEGVAQWKRKHGQPISLFALSANQRKGVKLLMDTGCGKAASLGVDIAQDKDEIVFQTANGTTSTSDSSKYYVNKLKEAVQPFVKDETPTVLSIGRRCMKMGYYFNWVCGKLPFMITPEKEMVHLHVKDDVPYLVGDRNARSNRPYLKTSWST